MPKPKKILIDTDKIYKLHDCLSSVGVKRAIVSLTEVTPPENEDSSSFEYEYISEHQFKFGLVGGELFDYSTLHI